jgi:protease I
VLLEGKSFALLATDGFEDSELITPVEEIKGAGGDVRIISNKSGNIEGAKGAKIAVDYTLAQANSEDYDGLLLPGGVANPDKLRTDEDAIAFIESFFENELPVAAICHAPWLLIEADAVRGRQLTSWPSLKTDLLNAGAVWLDEEVVVDEGLVTSRKPDDLEAFCEKMLEEFAEGAHKAQAEAVK